MILASYGSDGSYARCAHLLGKTAELCEGLDELGIKYFRDRQMNVVAIHAADLSARVARGFHLVPDRHNVPPTWWKIVVMDHVGSGLVQKFPASIAHSVAAQLGAQGAQVSA